MNARALAMAAALVALAAVLPHLVYPVLVMKLACFALFAVAFNLLLGFTGLLSFGHAAFFGFSAYAAGHAAREWGLTPELAILAGTAAAAGLGAVFGMLAIRRQGIYFAMVTLALAQMVFFLCLQAPFTGGEDGLQGIPRGRLLGIVDLADDTVAAWVVLAICGFGMAAAWRIVHSPFGAVLTAIRENEARALSLGYRVERVKLAAFVLSATLAGLAGATKAVALGLASLTDVAWTMSGEVVLMSLIGGVGTVLGPAAGAVILVLVQNELAGLGAWVTIVQGALFVTCVLAFREGVIGAALSLWRRLRGGRPSDPPASGPPASGPAAH